MDNVIKFPSRGKFIDQPHTPTTDDEVISSVSLVKINHINETLSTVVPMLFNNLELAGFDFQVEDEEGDENVKDGSFIVEAIRSMLCKYHGIRHPFQDISEAVFEKQDDGTYNLTKRLELDIMDVDVLVKGDSEG